jgi:hypothetical protein
MTKRFGRGSWAKVLFPLMIAILILSLSGTGMAGILLSKGAVFQGETVDNKGTRFPATIRITRIKESKGDLTGELSWLSLDAVHKIEGRIEGRTVVFKETEFIKKGKTILNCEYALIFDGQTLQGRWICEPGKDFGTAQFKLQK